jgi:hypothetical protein
MAIASVVTFIYSPYNAIKNDPDEMSRGGRVIYSSLKYTCWSLAIVWLIFACHFGYAGKHVNYCYSLTYFYSFVQKLILIYSIGILSI